jgi:hypothetical protein
VEIKKIMLLVLLLMCLPARGATQTAQEVNEANNPLTPKITINLQDQYVGSYHGLSDSDSNVFMIRSVLPHRLFGLPQILRATIPIATSPDPRSTTGLGDINLFNLFIFKALGVELGIGPQLTMDSASSDRLGTGRWQAGAAGVIISPFSWGLLGGLVTYQHSVDDHDTRPTQNNLSAQPFFIFNLPQGFYVRSSATWNFDLQRGNYYIPLGLGLGKVWKLEGGTTFNLFAEPQVTVARDGVAPKFQLFSGLNMQFPIGH